MAIQSTMVVDQQVADYHYSGQMKAATKVFYENSYRKTSKLKRSELTF